MLVADSDLAGRASFTVIEDIPGPHAVVGLTLAGDRVHARLSGISGSDPTCYCDATQTPGPASLLGLGLFALAALPRARRR